MRRRNRLPVAHAAEAALTALVFSAPLLLGGAPLWALWPTCALAGVAVSCAGLLAAARGTSLRVPLAAAIPGLIAALCALQLVPLPPWLLGVLSPRASELRQFALEPLGLTQWRPITLDPSATWRELAKHLAYVAAIVASAEVARSRRARTRLLGAVALAGALVAVIGLGHKVANVTSVFGLYAFKSAQPPIVTPFGNGNHLAAFLTLTGAVTLGFTSRSGGQRVAWGFLFVAQTAVAFLSLSRGGAMFFVAAQALFGAALLLKDRPRRALYSVAASMAALAVGAAVAVDQLWAEFAAGGSKTSLWPMLGRAAAEFWPAGMGRGAFELAFPRFQTELGGFALSHPENAVLQLGAELGLVSAAAVIALCATVWARGVSREELWTPELAGLCGLLALGAHELFDFSLELPPTAIAAAMLLGIVARVPDASDAPPKPGRTFDLKLTGLSAAAGGVGVLVAALAALWLGRSTPAQVEARLAEALATAKDRAAITSAVAEAMSAHPADSWLPAMAAQAYARAKAPQEALAFVNRALFLRPMDSASHRIAARALLELDKRPQAFFEYRLAISAGDAAAVREAIPRARTVEELDRLCPDDAGIVDDAITQLWLQNRPDHAVALANAVAERWAGKPEAAVLWARLVQVQVSRSDLATAKEALDRLVAADPDSARTAMARARFLAASGDAPGAVDVLVKHTAKEPGNTDVGFLLVEQLLSANQPRMARDALSRLSPFVSTPQLRAALFEAQGRAFEKEERFAKALEAYETASRLRPEIQHYHYAVARMHEHHRQPGAAARAVLAGMKVDSAAGAASSRAWADRLLEEERRQLDQSSATPQKTKEQLLNEKLLESDLADEDATTERR